MPVVRVIPAALWLHTCTVRILRRSGQIGIPYACKLNAQRNRLDPMEHNVYQLFTWLIAVFGACSEKLPCAVREHQ